MTAEEAVEKILDDVTFLESSRKLDETKLSYYVEKLVYDILDYCHREDFPATLVYTVTDLIRKRIRDEDSPTDEGTGLAIQGPLSSVKMDDTEFHFAVSSVDTTKNLAELLPVAKFFELLVLFARLLPFLISEWQTPVAELSHRLF